MVITLQVNEQGGVAIPPSLRSQYRIEEGDAFQLADLAAFSMLTPAESTVDALAADLEQAAEEAGLDVAEMLDGLTTEREQ